MLPTLCGRVLVSQSSREASPVVSAPRMDNLYSALAAPARQVGFSPSHARRACLATSLAGVPQVRTFARGAHCPGLSSSSRVLARAAPSLLDRPCRCSSSPPALPRAPSLRCFSEMAERLFERQLSHCAALGQPILVRDEHSDLFACGRLSSGRSLTWTKKLTPLLRSSPASCLTRAQAVRCSNVASAQIFQSSCIHWWFRPPCTHYPNPKP